MSENLVLGIPKFGHQTKGGLASFDNPRHNLQVKLDCQIQLKRKTTQRQQTVQLDRKKDEDAQRKCSNLYFTNELYLAMFGNCQSYLSHIFTASLLQILLDSLYSTDAF